MPAQGSSVVQVAFTPAAARPAPPAHADGRNALSAGHLPGLDGLAAGRAGAGVSGARAAARRRCRPASRAPRARGSAARAQGSGEFDGVRAYRRGDPLKMVVWKKAAKAGEHSGSDGLVSRDTQQAQRHELWLDLRQAGPPDLEAQAVAPVRLGAAGRPAGLDYGLRLSALEIKPGQRRGPQAPLPGGAGHMLMPAADPLASRMNTLRTLPRDGRDTLFLLAVIAWVLLPQAGHLPLWCSGAGGRGAAVARLAGAARPRRCPASWWLLALLALTLAATYAHARHPARARRGRDAAGGAAGAQDAGAAGPARCLRDFLPRLFHAC